jgi:hypothetical protein
VDRDHDEAMFEDLNEIDNDQLQINKEVQDETMDIDTLAEVVTTLILNEYQQSSNSSVLVFKFEVQRQLRLPIARYCLSVKLV